MCLSALNFCSHCDVWSTRQSSKYTHQTPFAVPWDVNFRPSSCLQRGAQIYKGKGILCHPHNPYINIPQTLAFLHGTEYLCLGNWIKPLTS